MTDDLKYRQKVDWYHRYLANVGSGVPLNSYYQAWLTQIIADGGTEPSASVKTAQNALIRDLDAAGFMSRMKWGWFLHAGDKTTCRRNIKDPSVNRLTESGTVTFLDANGCKSASSSYWNTGIAANSINYSLFSIVTYVSESATASNGSVFGARTSSGGNIYQLSPGVGGSAGQRDNSSSGGATTFASANHKADYIMTYDGTNCIVNRAGVEDSDAQTVAASNITAPLLLLCRNTSGINGGVTPNNYYTLYVPYLFAFDRLTAGERTTIKGLFDTFRTAAGIP